MALTGTDKVFVVDLSEIAEQIRNLADRDMKPAMDIVAESLVAAVSDKFAQEGPGWAPLATSTLASRRGGEAQILNDTGQLAGSIEPYSGSDFAEAATDKTYAVFHVSDEPREKIPLRDFFDLPPEVFDDAAEVILDHIVNG